MNDEEIHNQICGIDGNISDLNSAIEELIYYATYILEDTSELEQQLQPLEAEIVKLEAEQEELYKLA